MRVHVVASSHHLILFRCTYALENNVAGKEESNGPFAAADFIINIIGVYEVHICITLGLSTITVFYYKILARTY